MTNSYDYYIVTFCNDEEEIVMASSPEDAKEEQEAMYGVGCVKSVSSISREELVSSDFDAEENHEKNIAALGGDIEESIEEKLQPSDPMGKYISDFQKSDAPQFKGKSKEKRRQMAIAAKMSAESKGASKDDEEKFHQELDKLVHKTFGASDDEKKAMKEGRTLKTMAARYVTQRKRYNAANDEVKKTGANVHDVARKHNVDTKELQSMGENWASTDPRPTRRQKMHSDNVARMNAQDRLNARKKQKPQMQKEEKNPIMEGEDKLMYLARLGLMDKNEVLLLKRAMIQKNAGTPMSIKNRDLLFKLMEKLIRMIIDNPHMWNLARRKVMEDVLQEFNEEAVTESWNIFVTNYDKTGEK